MAGLSLLRVVSNSELDKEAADKLAVGEKQNTPLMLGIVAHLKTNWEAAKQAKNTIENIMLRGMRQRNGEYEADKLNAIRQQGGSEVYMMITEVKCRAAESWLRDILLDTGTPPWSIDPSPVPSLKPEQMREIEASLTASIMNVIEQLGRAPTPEEIAELKEVAQQEKRLDILQEAHDRTEKMRDKISDQFVQGGWDGAFNDFITDLVTFPAAFLKGPVIRRQRVLEWVKDEQGATVAAPKDVIAPEYERVDPFNMYPEPGINSLQEGYLFEHHPMTRTMLSELIGVPGYDESAIRMILEEGAPSSSWITQRSQFAKEQEERKFDTVLRPTDMFDALEFWGKISGKMLREWGMSKEEAPDEAQEYDANIWLVGNYIIKAELNYDPLGEKPYSKSSFIKLPGAFWGKGIPEILEDVQGVCNAAVRSLVNNMGIASGPQVEVNLERIPPNENITQLFPWKIWQVTNDPAGSSAPAVRFNQPNDNSASLMAVYERFASMADDHSGIPAYLYGDLNVHGAGRTSSGLSMLMGAAGKGVRQVVMYIDIDVIKPIVERQFIYNMRYDPDESIKGDVNVIPRGAANLATKEQMNTRRVEFLTATANPIDAEIMGREGRAAVLREISKSLQLPSEEVVPSREKAALSARAQSAPQQQQLAHGAPQGSPESTPTAPDGSPKGGQSGNLVSSKTSGQP